MEQKAGEIKPLHRIEHLPPFAIIIHSNNKDEKPWYGVVKLVHLNGSRGFEYGVVPAGLYQEGTRTFVSPYAGSEQWLGEITRVRLSRLEYKGLGILDSDKVGDRYMLAGVDR